MTDKLSPFIEKTVNQLLNKDPQKQHILSLTQGKTFGISITDWQIHLIIIPKQTGISCVRMDQSTTPDCTVAGSLSDLLALFQSPEQASKMFESNRITQTGDLTVLQHYQQAINAFEVSIPYHFSQCFGSELSYLFCQPFRQMKHFLTRSLSSTKIDIKEFLQEEAQYFPSNEQLDDFFDDIRELSLDVDRLQARLNSLIKREDSHENC